MFIRLMTGEICSIVMKIAVWWLSLLPKLPCSVFLCCNSYGISRLTAYKHFSQGLAHSSRILANLVIALLPPGRILPCNIYTSLVLTRYIIPLPPNGQRFTIGFEPDWYIHFSRIMTNDFSVPTFSLQTNCAWYNTMEDTARCMGSVHAIAWHTW